MNIRKRGVRIDRIVTPIVPIIPVAVVVVGLVCRICRIDRILPCSEPVCTSLWEMVGSEEPFRPMKSRIVWLEKIGGGRKVGGRRVERR